MALVAVPVWNTVENDRLPLVRETLRSLADTVDWKRHTCVVIDDNSSCPHTLGMYETMLRHHLPFTLICNEENVGTARSVNRGWRLRKPGVHATKVDSDLTFPESGWLDKLEECLDRDQAAYEAEGNAGRPRLGIVGLKRRDLDESPNLPQGHWAKSYLHMLPHEKGQRWLAVEAVMHLMSYCALHSSHLLDRVGYLVQMGKYAFDDSLMVVRARKAGFYSAFLANVDVLHPDPGSTPYQSWKEQYAGERMYTYNRLAEEYLSGQRDIFHGPDDDLDGEVGK